MSQCIVAAQREECEYSSSSSRKKRVGGGASQLHVYPEYFQRFFFGLVHLKPVCQTIKLSFPVIFLDWAGIIPNYPCQNVSAKQGLKYMGM
jgi:hypothetical protein